MPYTPPFVTLHTAARSGPHCLPGVLNAGTADAKEIWARRPASLSINIDNTQNLSQHDANETKQRPSSRLPCSLPPALCIPQCPPLSPNGMPSPPTTPRTPKMVHFDSNVQVCPFSQLESPISISAESSCADDDQLGLDQWPNLYSYPSTGDDSDDEDFAWIMDPTYVREPRKLDGTSFVQLCGLHLSDDNKMICGSLAVASTIGTQSVACRFTFDGWTTVSEVYAIPNQHTQQHIGYNRFRFEIDISGLAHLERRNCIFCVRCFIDGQEHWDNNDGSNFRVSFIRQHSHRHRKHYQRSHHKTGQQNIVDAATERWICPLTTAKSPAPAKDYFDISCASYEDIVQNYCFVRI